MGRTSLRQLALLIAEIRILRNKACGDSVFSERKYPDPAFLLETHVNNDRKSFFKTAFKFNVAPVRPDRGPIQLLPGFSRAKFGADERVSPACVHKKAGPMNAFATSRIQACHRH